jgi:hypothetical protein
MTYLRVSTVDGLGLGDVCMASEDVKVVEAVGGPVPEFDVDKVTEVGGIATAELDDQGRRVVG